VTFTPRLPANGAYFVYVRNVPGSDRASNVPVSVAGKSMTVDQRSGTGWKLLGQFNLVNGDSVVISNSGTSGMVVADAVRFVKTNSSGLHTSSARASGSTGAATAAFKAASMTSSSTIFSLVRSISEDDSKNLLV
jgi:hypothetical protein